MAALVPVKKLLQSKTPVAQARESAQDKDAAVSYHLNNPRMNFLGLL